MTEQDDEPIRDLLDTDGVRPRHDRFARRIFGEPREARGLLRAALPAVVAEAIDWAKLRLLPTNEINDELQEDVRDLVFEARWHDGSVVLIALLEHLSAPDQDMPRRVGSYEHGLWAGWRRRHPTGPLPVILPIVLYQGPPAWSGPRSFAEQLAVPAQLRDALGRRVPDFEPDLVELPSLGPEELRRIALSPAARIALTLLRLARTDADLLVALQRLSAELADLWSQPGARGLFRLIVTYTMIVRPEISREALVTVVKQAAGKEAGEVVLSLPARMLAQGRAEGRAEGRVEGRAEASRSILMGLLGTRFGTLDQATRDRIERASVDELMAWILRAPGATSLPSVFAS